MITNREIDELYSAILMRKPEGEHIYDWWKGMGIEYQKIRSALLSSEEFQVLQDREQASKNRQIPEREIFQNIFDRCFNNSNKNYNDYEIDVKLDVMMIIKKYIEKVRPDLVISIGGKNIISYIKYISEYSDGYTKCITNYNNYDIGSDVVHLGLQPQVLLNFVDSQNLVYNMAIVDASENIDDILAVYKRGYSVEGTPDNAKGEQSANV